MVKGGQVGRGPIIAPPPTTTINLSQSFTLSPP